MSDEVSARAAGREISRHEKAQRATALEQDPHGFSVADPAGWMAPAKLSGKSRSRSREIAARLALQPVVNATGQVRGIARHGEKRPLSDLTTDERSPPR
jgi:hypothetical protein